MGGGSLRGLVVSAVLLYKSLKRQVKVLDQIDFFGGLAGEARTVILQDLFIVFSLLKAFAYLGQLPILLIEILKLRRSEQDLFDILAQFLVLVLRHIDKLRVVREGAILAWLEDFLVYSQ